MRELNRLLPEIVTLADRAGATILEYYRGDVAVRAKADASPVTAADEAAIRPKSARAHQLGEVSVGTTRQRQPGWAGGCR